MEMKYEDLVHDEGEAQELRDNCPYIEDDLSDCDRFYLDRYTMSKKPWFMPGVNIFYVGGFNTIMALRMRTDDLHSWEDVKKRVEELTEAFELKKYLLFKKCPRCGLELPAIDFRTREDGLCTFCGSKLRAESINPNELRRSE